MHTESIHKAYDIIGDVHGHGLLLEKLLLKLGYHFNGYNFAHPERQAIFCGDFIDRGHENIKALDIVMRMHAAGAALAIPGNHDLAFVQYHTTLPGKVDPIIPPNRHHEALFRETLQEFRREPKFMASYLEWIVKLPLFIELPDLRVYHGYFQPAIQKQLTLNAKVMCYADVLKNFSMLNPLADLITKSLSTKVEFTSDYGRIREKVRVKWWKTMPDEFSKDDLLLHNNPELQNIKISSVDEQFKIHWSAYPEDEKPLFLGHFCITGPHGIMLPNLCIIDLCVIKTGRLAAYRYDGEKSLQSEKIVFVNEAN
ncbi:MAG: metallophosphoesterase [Flavobacteriales bacterium]